MSRRGLTHSAIALTLLLQLFAIGPAQAEDFSILVPENCWPMAGGGPARNGFTRTRPLRGALHVAWTREFKGEIEGEPLVWDDTIVVSVKISEEKRELHMLALKTGKSLGKRTTVKTDMPLIPSLWRRRLAIRDDGGISLYRVGRMKLTKMWTQAVPACSDLQLVAGKITYCNGSGVQSRVGREGGPRTESVAEVYSELLQDTMCAHFLTYDGEGNGSWISGRPGGKVFVGHHEGRIPGRLASAAICGDEAFIRTALPMSLKSGGSADTIWLRRTGRLVWVPRTLLSTAMLPVGSHERRVLLMHSLKAGWQLVRYEGLLGAEPKGLVLASPDLHPDLLEHRSMTMAREMLHLGPTRIDLKTLDLYQPLPVQPIGRVIPARDALLAVTGPGVLVSLREAESEQDKKEAAICPAATETSEQTGRVVDTAGRVKKAKLSWTGGTVKVGGKPLSPDRVLLARAQDGTIAHAGSVHGALEGLALLIENEEGKGYAKLATAAVKALDTKLAERFITAAEDRGATNDVSTWTRRRLVKLNETPSGKKPRKKAVKSALEDEAKLLSRTTDWIWASYSKLGPGTAWHVRAELLRAVLERMPDQPGAVAAVRAAIPEGVPLPETFDARRWLMLADAVQADPVRISPPDGPDRAPIEVARRTWDKNVIGLRSKNLLILTPAPDPAQIASCLATGEFVCRALEDLFGKAKPDDDPLVLHLFRTRQAYLKATAGMSRGHVDERTKASAGHYNSRLNLSRIFLPGGEDAFADVTHTYQHELVHHWLQARCPLPRTRGARGHGPWTPGFWLVEGIAELFGEFKFDLRRREVTTQDPRAASLDIVAHAPDRRRIPWPALLTVNQALYAQLKLDDVVPVPVRWRVGLRRPMTQTGMFYAQAAATAHYLYHRSDKTRGALVELVRKYYEGSLTAKDLEKIAGLTPEKLGQAVRKYARR